MTGKAGSPWRVVSAEYRELLFGFALETVGGETPEGRQKRRGGYSAERIAEVWESGGKLPLAAVLRCKVRYFTDGVVLGRKPYVDAFLERNREGFGPRRESGARAMRGAQWGEMRTLRDLRVEPVVPPTPMPGRDRERDRKCLSPVATPEEKRIFSEIVIDTSISAWAREELLKAARRERKNKGDV